MKKQTDGLLENPRLDDQLLNIVLAAIHEVISVCDMNGICQFVSSTIYEFTGHDPDELIGIAWTTHCHADDVVQFNAFFNCDNQSCSGGDSRIEYRYQCKNGQYRWLETEFKYFYVEAGAPPNKVAMISRDITMRKKALQKKVEDYLFWVFDKLKAGVWSERPYEIGGGALRPWWVLLGYGDNEIDHTWKGWLKICHPLDRKKLCNVLQDCSISSGKNELDIKYRIRHKNGAYHSFLASGRKNVSWKDHDETLSWRGIVVDITELEMLETAQYKRETQLKDFVRAFCDVSAIIDETGHCVEIVAKNEQLLLPSVGLSRGKSIIHKGIFAEKADLILGQIHRALRECKLEMCSFEYADKGQRKFVRMKFSPMNYLVKGRRTVAVLISWSNEAGKTDQIMDFALLFKRRSRFMDDLLRDDRTTGLKRKNKTEADAIDFPIAFFCCVVRLQNTKKEEIEWFHKRQLMIMQYLSEVQGLFVWEYQESIGILVDVGVISVDDDTQFVTSIMEMIGTYDSSLLANAGVSQRQTGLSKVGKCCKQAMRALLVAEHEAGNQVLHFSDLGIYKVLAAFNNVEGTQEYVQDILGNLVEYDRSHETNLVNILNTILKSVNLKVAAKQLFFHYNTIVRKQKFIEGILECSLDNPKLG